jgi:hypothetical protein
MDQRSRHCHALGHALGIIADQLARFAIQFRLSESIEDCIDTKLKQSP